MVGGEWNNLIPPRSPIASRHLGSLSDGPPRPIATEFDSILRRARASDDPREQARHAAEEFVAQVLVLPVLKSIREQNQAAPPFAPGPYERSIGSLFDMEVASRMVRAQRLGIVDAVARNLLREGKTSPAATGAEEQGGSDVGPNGTAQGTIVDEARRGSAG